MHCYIIQLGDANAMLSHPSLVLPPVELHFPEVIHNQTGN
jgi:hypothetical protein